MWIEILAEKYISIEVGSPSTRRVWIEIIGGDTVDLKKSRHPPHGGCGLKSKDMLDLGASYIESPSTRRVWIEI